MMTKNHCTAGRSSPLTGRMTSTRYTVHHLSPILRAIRRGHRCMLDVRKSSLTIAMILALATAVSPVRTPPIARPQPRARPTPTPARTPKEFKALKYRSIGPAAGGRVSRAAGVPGDPATYYAATASGGVWKSTDGGATWKPIFDDQPISSIGSIAVAPSNPNVVYVGLGRSEHSRQRRRRQRHLQIGRRRQDVDPRLEAGRPDRQDGRPPANPDIAFAAVLGHAFGPNPERGVYRTTDGGKTWRQVLKKDDEHRRIRRRDRSVESVDHLRRLLAGAPAALGSRQRRARQRPVRVPRRRRHLEAARRAKGCPTASGEKSASRSRHQTAAASTRLIEAEKAASSDPTMAARPGSSSTRRARCASVPGTTRP